MNDPKNQYLSLSIEVAYESSKNRDFIMWTAKIKLMTRVKIKLKAKLGNTNINFETHLELETSIT